MKKLQQAFRQIISGGVTDKRRKLVYKPIGINNEDYFFDVNMSIVDYTVAGDDYEIIVMSDYNGKNCGLKFHIKTGIKAGVYKNQGRLNPAEGIMQDAVRISTLGEESDNFVQLLSRLYGYPTQTKFTTSTIRSTAFSLNEEDLLFQPQVYKFKLFFQGVEEEMYAELFLVLDLIHNRIELNEKDESYRKCIINFFTGEWK